MKWLRKLIREEVGDIVRHREPVSRVNESALVQLILDLHKKDLSFRSEVYLRELNISPEKYRKREKGEKQ